MSNVKTASKEFQGMNCLAVEAGTNCPMGGDSGHGGRTLLKLRNNGGTDLRIAIDGGAMRDAQEIDIVLGGDSECITLVKALKFALRTLKAQKRVNKHSINSRSLA